jgi:heme oxygenase (biliverdin-producing, ferredoxin)
MKCFLKGVVERQPLAKLLANLYFVYSTLEEYLPKIEGIYLPELNRKANLEQDLAYYYGQDWQDQISATSAGKSYVERIQTVAQDDPILLVAHAYTRYMGDLSGGQSLKKIIRSALNLPEDQGTALYEFPQISDKGAFKAKYREALNALALDQQTIERIVQEANYAFALNSNVLGSLTEDLKKALGEHVFDLLIRQDIPGATEHPVAV